MSYRVQYETNMKWEKDKETGFGRRYFLTGVFFLLFLGWIFHFWEQGKQVFLKLLLPGDPAVTWAALETMVLNLEQGVSLPVAAQELCNGIIQSVY